MESKLIKLSIPPGMYKNGTRYEGAGRWYDGRLVRFFEGTIRPVGGWVPQVDENGNALASLTGTARAGLAWRYADGSSLQGIGTISLSASKLYVISGGALFDVTPAGLTAGKVDAGGSVPGAYGAGAYGQGLYGTGASLSQPVDPDTWTLDVFGSYLVGVCTATNLLYVWQGNTGTIAAVPAWGPAFTGSLVTAGAIVAGQPAIQLTASTITGIILAGQTFVISGVTYTAQLNTGPLVAPAFTGSLVTSGSTSGGATSIILTASTLAGTVAQYQTFTVSGTTYTAQAAATAVSNSVTVSILPAVGTTIANGTAVAFVPTLSVLVQPEPAASVASGTSVTGTSAQAPGCTAAVVTPEHFLVALGAFDSTLGTLNSKLVAWASQATTSVWGPLAINTAGSFPLTTLGRIMSGARTKVETLIFTDADVWRMTFIGGTLVYAFSQAGDQCGIIAPNAHAVVDSAVYWMGRKGFYMYNGYVQPVPCDVQDFIFGNLNDLQRAKIWALPVPGYGEVWWWYPSNASTEIDSYVIYNYRENHWSTGTFPEAYVGRTAGAPAGPIQYPMMIDTLGTIWQHECGSLRSLDASALSTILAQFLELGPVEVGYPVAPYGAAGDNVVTILRIVPDEQTLGDMVMQAAVSLFPTDPYTYGPGLTIAQPTDVRMKGRLIRLKFTATGAQGAAADWRIGTVRLGVKLGGKR